MSKPRIATLWLEGCAGCHMSLLDLDEALLEVLSQVELTVTPVTDFKDFDFPAVDVGIVEGAVGNREQLELIHRLRKQCRILVGWGDCAVFGGVNTLRNGIPADSVLRCAFLESAGIVEGCLPQHEELPELLPNVLPVGQVVELDVHLPGCPPSPEVIAFSLTEILQGRMPVLPRDLIHFD